jgi:hypothetical protein
MRVRKREGRLTTEEEGIVKALLSQGWRNQDIQALVNIGRIATINSARITEVKQDSVISPAQDDAVEFYKLEKQSFDPRTGLSIFHDERLIRAREAMIVAVQIFNSPILKFKTEIFAVLAHIAWTYLLHEYYTRRRVKIIGDDGRSLLLTQILRRADCPLSSGIKRNLEAMTTIRNEVEHNILGQGDLTFLPIFQACCLNFDKTISDMFGAALSLQSELAFSLQFAKMNIDQLAGLQKYGIPDHIQALDARLQKGLSEEEFADLEYQFRVVYTLDSASKSRAHIQFVHPNSAEGKEISNILVKYKTADDLYPYKPNAVVKAVSERSQQKFTGHNHTQAWRLYSARPRQGAKRPEETNKDYCIYHPAHGDYTYSEKWVEHLVGEIEDEEKWAAIKAYKI